MLIKCKIRLSGEDDYYQQTQNYYYEVDDEDVYRVCAKDYMRYHKGTTYEEAYDIVSNMDFDEFDWEYEDYLSDYYHDAACAEFFDR